MPTPAYADQTTASHEPLPYYEPEPSPSAPPRRTPRPATRSLGRPGTRSVGKPGAAGRGGYGRNTGRNQRRTRTRSSALGIFSILCFVAFWLIFIALGSATSSMINSGAVTDSAAGALVAGGLLAMAMPVIGLILGIIGCVVRTSERGVAITGIILNALLLLWMLRSLIKSSVAG